MARGSRTRNVRDFETREKNLRDIVLRCFGVKDARITKIIDQCGPSIYEDFDFIVVSLETLPMAEKITDCGKEKLVAMQISVIEYKLAQDQVRISSTRVSEGKIDRHGKILIG